MTPKFLRMNNRYSPVKFIRSFWLFDPIALRKFSSNRQDPER
jgi:hypothetical protein